MRAVCVVVAVLAAVAAVSATNVLIKDMPFSEQELTGLFHSFKTMYGKQYASHEEERRRFEIFKGYAEFIRAHNVRERAGLESYKTAINPLCDLTEAEYRQMYLSPMNRTRPLNERHIAQLSGAAVAAPAAVDWREKGAVTPVKNQGQCGSCWSFSTTGSVEGRYEIAFDKLTSLSEQQLMDCSKKEGDQSCNGGLMDYAFEYIEKNDGIDSEADYPYLARNEKCKKEKESRSVADVSRYHDVPKGSEDQLQAAVAEGPVSVAIEADQRGFQTYHSGVFDGACGKQLDHGVLAVGYGTENGEDYWIVKNSWGHSWGDKGYIKMVRGKNQCGIAESASYPVAKKVEVASEAGVVASAPVTDDSDYEDPKPNGCHSGETPVRINGVNGDYCAPSCNGQGSACPAVPSGTTAQAECVVEKPGSSGPTLCALICQPSDETGSCPGTSTCKPIQGVGICTYDD